MQRLPYVSIFIIWIALHLGPCQSSSAAFGQDVAPLTKGWAYCFTPPSSCSQFDRNELNWAFVEKFPWRPWNPKQTLEPEPGKVLWLKKRLNELDIPSAALFLPRYSAFRGFEIYLDHRRLYQSGALVPSFINRHLYLQWHLIPLPVDYFGKTLYFQFFSDHPHIIGFHTAIYLGTPEAILSRMVLDDLYVAVMGFLMMMGGLFGGLLFMLYYRLKNLPLAYAGLAAVSGGIYAVTESSATLLMIDHPILLSYLHYGTLFLFAAGIFAFMEQTVAGSWKKFYRWGALFQIAYLATAVLLDLGQVVSWDILFNTELAFLFLCIVVTEFQLIRLAIAGNLEAKLLCLGFGFLGLSGGWDILVGLRLLPPQPVVFPMGLFFLVGFLALALILRYRAERWEARETIRKNEERFRNLFENAPISILEVDFSPERPRVIHVNRTASRLFLLEKENGNRLFLDNLLSDRAMEILHNALSAPEQKTYAAVETTCLRQDQTRFPARLGVSRNAFSGLARVVLTVEDTTEEKRRRSEEEAIAEERRRIAREIHDGLAQDLAVMNMKASVWPRLSHSFPDKMESEIRFFQSMLKKSLIEVRRCIFALRPVELETMGFFEGVRRFLKDFGEQNHLNVSLKVQGAERDLPPRLEPALFRVVQEALNNTRKYASARTVKVYLEIAPHSTIRLTITDDGQGFDTGMLPSAFSDGHLGIKQMEERISSLGGTFHIRSGNGEGAAIEVSVPFKISS